MKTFLLTVISLCSFASFSAETDPKDSQSSCNPSEGIQENDALRAVSPFDSYRFVFSPGGAGFVDRDGALGIKFGWDRRIRGDLIVGGRRLDGDAPPARAYMNSGYGDIGFQASYLVFPSPGCWEITGRIGDRSLTFTVLVERLGNGPEWKYPGIPPGGFWYQTTLEAGRSVPNPHD